MGKFLEFFAARIAYRRTRAAYGRAVGHFPGLALDAVSPLHVAAYIRTHPGSAPTVKPHLAAIRMLGDWSVVSQVLPVNPAAAVRGPKHVVTKGATPVLSPAEARRLLEAIDTAALAGRRDRALVSVMLYSFARVSAVIGMRRQDYFRQESRGWLRLHEKGGKRHDVPAHHRAAEALDDYLAAAGLDEAKAALFQSVDPAGRRLTGRALSRRLVLAMINRYRDNLQDITNLHYSVRRDKAPFLSGCESRPATVAPAGSSRSGRWRQRHRLKHSDDKGPPWAVQRPRGRAPG